MDLQLTITLVLILAAAFFVGRRIWQTWLSLLGKGSCGGGGCARTSEKSTSTQETFIPLEKLRLRRQDVHLHED